jgi:hypothetical protein
MNGRFCMTAIPWHKTKADFRDASGRKWTLLIDAAAKERMSEIAGVRWDDMLDNDGVRHIASDAARLASVLYAICEPQANARAMSGREFGLMLGGAPFVIERATAALIYAVTESLPEDVRRRIRVQCRIK